MGFSVERFVKKPDPNLMCGICACVLRDAVLTRCGHAFCQACLDTWLSRPLAGTCPQCRTCISKFQVSPVWAIRELIHALPMYCANADRGCTLTLRVDQMEKHLDCCGYAPIECAACGEVVNRLTYLSHTAECNKSKYGGAKNARSVESSCQTMSECAPDLEELNRRLNALEIQLKHSRKQLHLCQADNRKLERELSRTRVDLQRKRGEYNLLKSQLCEFDPDYAYGFHPDSVSKLSLVLTCHLRSKPEHMDRDRVFNCVQRCYDNFARCGSRYEHDVHMLVATAFASNWFADNQRINFHCWLQSIARYRKYADWGRSTTHGGHHPQQDQQQHEQQQPSTTNTQPSPDLLRHTEGCPQSGAPLVNATLIRGTVNLCYPTNAHHSRSLSLR